jgi:hypothetical protein
VNRLVSLWREVGAALVWLPELHEPTTPEPPEGALPDRDPVLLTALLCSGATAALRRLKASNAEIERAATIERGPETPAGEDDRSVRRWLAATGTAADDLSRLWALRHGSIPPWDATVAEIRRRGEPLSRADLAVSGTDIAALGVGGPNVGRILGQLLERVLDDPGLNTRATLLTLARAMT